MKLKNYNEDLVLSMIDLVLEDRTDVESSENLVHDVAAYVLNRIPPRYIMSERGFTRMAGEHWVESENDGGLTNFVELVILVNKAIELITHRRRAASNGVHSGGELGIGELELWHNFPQVVGKIVDADTREPVYGATIAFLVDGEHSRPAEPSWSNPYATNAATKGFFSFWPQSMRSKDEASSHELAITVAHESYQQLELQRQIDIQASLTLPDSISGDNILNLETLRLKRAG